MREMKDSGVEWIGKIPKDWEIVPLTKQYSILFSVRKFMLLAACFRLWIFAHRS